MRYEILKISNLFDKNNIEYVVLKGMAMEIKEIDACREFRDLDILINKKDLKNAYKLLRASGYRYFNSNSNDSIEYIRDMHHIPPMVNDAGVIVELHHRVTKSSIFKLCPLINVAFLEKERCEGINVPSDKFLLAHTLYHGILHHELNFGPNFLLDIKSILTKNFNADCYISDLLENLNLTGHYNQAKLLIKSCNHKKSVDDSLIAKFNFMFGSKRIFPTKANLTNKRVSLSRLIRLIRYTSFSYQLPYSSPKLIYFVIKSFLGKLYD